MEESERAWLALGKVHYQASMTEEKSRQFKRSLYFAKDLPTGTVITPDCIRAIRPGYGLAPKYWDQIMGKALSASVKRGDRVSFNQIDMQPQKEAVPS